MTTAEGYNLEEKSKSIEEDINPPSQIYDYRKDSQDYKLTIKTIKLVFNKIPCTTLIINDHTPFYQLNKLEEKYQKIFLASVVHDIRTPIQGVMGILEMLEMAQLKAEEYSSIHIAQSTCKLLLFLTHDITDLGQIEGNKLKIKEELFNIDEVVTECIKLMGFNYSKKGILLEKEIRGRIPFAFSDRHRYTQILINLLGNALKFTVEGFVRVTVSFKEEEDAIYTEVKDTGIGIKEEDIPKLFKLFGRAEESTSLNPQGVGLGLTICKKLSEAMGGKIWVKSKYGAGSEFAFSISCATRNIVFPSPYSSSRFLEEDTKNEKEKNTRMMAQYGYRPGKSTFVNIDVRNSL